MEEDMAPPKIRDNYRAGGNPKKKEKKDNRVSQETFDLNTTLSQMANRKQLLETLEKFEEGVAAGLVNEVSYTILINAQCICGNVEKAEALLGRMQKQGLTPGVVAYTTVLKGHCGRGDTKAMHRILDVMAAQDPPVRGNIRTVNTCLRGCLMIGEVEEAMKVLSVMKGWHVSPDVSGLEYLIDLNCRSLRIADAKKFFAALESLELGPKEKRSAMGASLALLSSTAALLEQWDLADETAKRAEGFLKELDDDDDDEEEEQVKADKAEGDAAEKKSESKSRVRRKSTDGGKRGWRKGGQGDTREESLKVFFATKREEQAREVALVRGFVEGKKSASLDIKALRRNVQNVKKFILDKYFPRLLFFKSSQNGEGGMLGAELVQSLRASFGLDQHLMYVFKRRQLASGNPKAESLSGKTLTRGVNKLARSMAASMDALFDGDGKLQFRKVFPRGTASAPAKPQAAGSTISRGKRVPVFMEVCSGNGEWAAAQAKDSLGTANWVTIELRHARVHRTFSRMIFQDIPNLLVVGGDANQVLPKRVQSNSVRSLFINHPEPPQQRGGYAGDINSSQAQHLLQTPFFKELHRVLEPGGMLTIVTDNKWYANLLLGDLSSICGRSGSAEGGALFFSKNLTQDVEVYSSEGNLTLFEGKPSQQCGHATNASSYFQRIFGEQSSARYILCLQKYGSLPTLSDDDDDDDEEEEVAVAKTKAATRRNTKKRKRENSKKIEKSEGGAKKSKKKKKEEKG